MAACLLALGSNLGDRAANLRAALSALEAMPSLRVGARSAWHETAPVGGPASQGPYLNGAVLVHTALEPAAVWSELLRIETSLGRVRNERWEARTVDLDLLLYGEATIACDELTVPHPRMHYRRFVLAPAAEVAPAMVHPESGWTIARLLAQLDGGADEIAVAAADPHLGAALVAAIARHFRLTESQRPRVRPWRPTAGWSPAGGECPRLILAAVDAAGSGGPDRRKMLQLPTTGPVAWLALGDDDALTRDAVAAVSSVWPDLAPAP
jgi:2-amino-4-hydroxy-6-hydroxymethyldihydropteridine diphosphokinase